MLGTLGLLVHLSLQLQRDRLYIMLRLVVPGAAQLMSTYKYKYKKIQIQMQHNYSILLDKLAVLMFVLWDLVTDI